MPYILAIDTSTDACSVAISTPSGIFQSLSYAPREHTQKLLPSIEALLAQHQLSLKQFDAIAFSAGPGSFTGLRIGLSTAQGLAYGVDIPLIPVSTLMAMAQTARRLGVAKASQLIVPVIDARMNEVYWSAYRADSQTQGVLALHPEMVESPEAFSLDKKIALSQQSVVGVGSGWHYSALQAYSVEQQVVEFYPQAEDVASLAGVAFADNKVISPLEALPVYMRDEVSWKKRQKIRG